MTPARFIPCILLAALVLPGPLAAQAQSAMPTVELSIGLHRVEAERADSFATRAQGLMHRRQMAANRGMLFVFDRAERHCMWMRNTLIPLSVAFIDESGAILNIEDMAPQTEDTHCAAAPARYALEMNAGWFAQRKLAPGARVSGIESPNRPVPAR